MMNREIERKFLIQNDAWRVLGTPRRIRQGYIARSAGCTVRIRETETDCVLTIKSSARDGMSRDEFEYTIPRADAVQMLDTLAEGGIIEKTRTRIPDGEHVWEVDEFFGKNTGLIIAEIELSDLDEAFVKPDWVGKEVTFEPRYTNAALSAYPYVCWSEEEKTHAKQ